MSWTLAVAFKIVYSTEASSISLRSTLFTHNRVDESSDTEDVGTVAQDVGVREPLG